MKKLENNLKSRFLSKVNNDISFISLFENLPGILFFSKNIEGRIVSANSLFAQHCGFDTEEQILGLNDDELFPPELAEQYIKDDLALFKSAQAKKDIIELFPNYLGDPTWFVTNKIPLFDSSENVIGVCGTCQSLEDSTHFVQPYLDLSKALDFIKENYQKKIKVEELAAMVNLSVRQFERRFKQTFKTTSHQYVIKLRILRSCKMLLKDGLTIAEIATSTGFYDQSSYTKSFKKFMRKTPAQYQHEHC